ncbi:PHO85 cyclin-1 [Coemansia sp. Benny D115]|nr:PHO85 cyclin-1 [Coemansia sp. Benny D115]
MSMFAAPAGALAAPGAVSRPTQTLQTLYHIPSTLNSFTVEYLSKLFLAVEKPNSKLKLPDRPVDERKFPEFRNFIHTLLVNGHISADTLVHALIYLSRFHRRVAQKQAVVEEGAKHKLFLVALLVASKFCDDRYPLATITVSEFLPRNLLTLAEINRMERAFLKLIKYKLIVDPDELALLLSRHGIDIRQIAKAIAQRLNPSPPVIVEQPGQLAVQDKPLPLVSGAIPQRAVAGHSISARTTRRQSGAGLIGGAPMASLASGAMLKTTRMPKPLPPMPVPEKLAKQREALDIDNMFKSPT